MYPSLAQDTFIRANQSGWGTASDGNSWAIDTGAATLSIVSNEGQVTANTSLTFIQEGSASSADFDVQVRCAANSTNFNALGVFARGNGSNTAYRARLNTNSSSIGFAIVKTIAGTSTTLVSETFTASLNTFYWIRFRGVGSLLFAMIWADGSPVPTSWALTTTDTSITGAGTVGIVTYTTASADIAKYDSFYAIDYAEHERLTSFDSVASVQATVLTTINEQMSSAYAEATSSPTNIPNTTGIVEQLTTFDASVLATGIGSLGITESLNSADAEAMAITTNTSIINEQIGMAYAEATLLSTTPYVPYPALVNDTFTRANQSGFGIATDGNTYTIDSGAATLSILSNQGKITGVTGLTFIQEGSASSADFDIIAQVSASSTNYTVIGVYARQTAATTLYRARINTNDSSIGFAISKTVAGTTTTLVSMSFTTTLNTLYNIRFRGVGSLLFAKIWAVNTAEPTSWSLTTTDTSITGPGTLGIAVSTTSSTDVAMVDNLYAIDYSEHELLTTFNAVALVQASIPANVTVSTEQIGMPYAEAQIQSSAIGNVTSQQVTLSNTGSDDGTWTASSNASWLLVSPASGTLTAGNSTTITVSTNSDGLNPGTYNATLTLVMSNANTVQVPVALTVISSSSAPQSVTLTNTGGASGNWNAMVSSGASWLTLSSSSGTLAAGASTTVNVFVDSASLSAGTYSASVTFGIAGANSVTVPVTVTVGSTTSATIGIAPSSLTFNGIVGSLNTSTQTATLTNSGNEAGQYSTSIVYDANASGWLALSPQTGSIPGNGTQVLTFSLATSVANLAAGSYTATVTFAVGAQTTSLTVTLVVQAIGSQGSTQTVLIAEEPVTVEWPLVVINKIDQQSTANFIVLDMTAALVISQDAKVIINDSLIGVVFTGYVATVETTSRLYPNTCNEHIVNCKDERYLAAKRLFTGKDYTNRLAGDIVADLMQGYLTPEGVSASYAIRHDNSTATFAQGTLTNTTANNDIELAPAGNAYSVSENLLSGTLTNMYAGTSLLQLRPWAALKFVGTASQGISNTLASQQGNNYYYAKIWGGNVSIASGDTLQYGMWISSTSPEIKSGVDGICSDGTTLRDYNNRYLLDQNHLALHPATDLSGYANDQWYTRVIDLTPVAGKALSTITIAFEGDNSGTYTSYFRSVWLIDSSGNVKQNFYVGTLYANGGLSNIGYSAISLTQITAYERSGIRVSSANTITGVGVVRESTIAWTTDAITPKDTALIIESSIDGGATWQACTSGMALPSLLAGANANNITLMTRQRLMLTGPSPELTPTLYGLQWSVSPSYACTKTDVQKIETTQADFAGGTNSAVLASNGNISLNGAWRDWRSSNTANQTFFGYGSQGTVTGQAVVTVAPGGKEGRSRLDFAGTWSDFTAELDVTVSSHGNASFVYRTTNWQTGNNYHGYNVDLTATQVLFGRGSSSGTYTQIATAAIDLSQGTSFRLTVVASGSNHRIYVNGGLYINATDTTYSSGQFGLRFLNNDSSITYSGFFGNFGVVQALSGSHISNAIPLNGVNTIGSSVVQWDADIPQGGAVDVAVSFDKSTWTSCTNGGTIPGIVNGATNAQKTLYMRTTVSSGNAAANAVVGRDLNTYLTPTVHGVSLLIASQVNASGTRVSPALQLDTVGTAGSTSISWSQNAPAGTSIGIDVSLNGGASWTDVTTQNGGPLPGINQGDALSGKSVVTRIRALSTVPTLTPQVTDLTIAVRNSDIQSGSLIPSTSYAFQSKIDACMDDLASKSNYWWAIKNGRLFFQNRAGIPAPWVLDSSNATSFNGQAIGDVLLNPAPRLMKQSDKYRNRHWIINALTPTASPISETKTGDGKTQSWTLTYPIAQDTLSITRAGNVVSVGIQGLDVGRDFYYTPGQNTLVQNPNATPLQGVNGSASAEVLAVVYTGLTPQPVMAESVAQQQALAAIDKTTGIVEEVEDATTLYPNGLLADAAQQLCQARIDQYANLGRQWNSSTLRSGLDAGMLQTVNIPQVGLNNAALLITQIQINYMPGMTRYDLTYLEGYNPKSWEAYYNPN